MANRIRRDVILRRLVAARDLLSDRENWTRGAFARNADGGSEEVTSRRAVSFCALGALQRVTREDKKRLGDDRHYAELQRRVEAEVPSEFPSIMSLNDSGGIHARRRVVGTFNRAIRKLESELA